MLTFAPNQLSPYRGVLGNLIQSQTMGKLYNSPIGPGYLYGGNFDVPYNTGNPHMTGGMNVYSIDPTTGQYVPNAAASQTPGPSTDPGFLSSLLTGVGFVGGAMLGAGALGGALGSGTSALDQAITQGYTTGLADTAIPGSAMASAGTADAGGVTLGAGAADTAGAAGAGGMVGTLGGGASDLAGTSILNPYSLGTASGAGAGFGGLASGGASLAPGAAMPTGFASAAGSAASPGFFGSLGNFLGTPGGMMSLGQLGSSAIGGLGSYLASQQQAGAAQNATNAQVGMFNQVMGNLQPYIGAGQQSLGQLQGYLNASPTGGPGGSAGLLHPFGPQDLATNLAPNYQFQLGQGLGQIANQAAATGMSGNALTGLQSYAQDYASNAYQNAFQNYQTTQGNIYSRLGNLAQLGQQSATGGASGAPIFASGISNTIQGLGAANAAGTVGMANAASGGVNNLLGYYMLNQMMQNQNPFGG